MNRRKQYFRVLIAFCGLLILLFVNTCQKIDLTREAFVQTNSYNVGNGVVTFTGTIIDLGEGISDHGFVVSNTAGPKISGGLVLVLRLGSASQTGQFTYDLSEVSGGANLYFRAFATSGEETIYGESSNFSTPALVVSTQTATIQSKSSAILNGVINDLGFESVIEYGFYWSLTENPQGVNKELVGSDGSTGTFSKTISGLTYYADYYYVAYATNNTGTKYGSVKRFKIENIWTRIGNFDGNARANALAFSLGGFGYIAGGHDAGDINNFYQFSPDPENWISISSGSSPVNGTAFTISNKAYVFNGDRLYQFDPDQSIWTEKTLFPGILRYGVFAFGIGDRGFIGSGKDDNDQYFNDVWEFNPKDPTNGTDIIGNAMGSWTLKTDFPGEGRMSAVGFSIFDKEYVCSGYNETNGNLSDLWQYDPFSTDNDFDTNGNPMGAWSQKTDYPGIPGSAQVSFIIRNKAYVFKDNELWQYNPLTENWKQLADFPGQPRYAPVGFAINNKGYVGTGTYNDGGGDIYLDDFWEYLPIQY